MFNADKVLYYILGKTPQRTFRSTENPAAGLKAGMNGLLLLCADAVRFMIRRPSSLKREEAQQVPSLDIRRSAWPGHVFWIGSIDTWSLSSESSLSVRDGVSSFDAAE